MQYLKVYDTKQLRMPIKNQPLLYHYDNREYKAMHHKEVNKFYYINSTKQLWNNYDIKLVSSKTFNSIEKKIINSEPFFF